MKSLKVISKHWEIVVDVGNDWGKPSYMEVRKYKNREEVIDALEYMDYYDTLKSIKEVVEYKEGEDEKK